jgi:hypothetical protein
MVELHASEKPVVLISVFRILKLGVLATAPPRTAVSSAMLGYLH